MKDVTLLVAAGGRGHRLGPVTFESVNGYKYRRYPKGMLPLNGEPVLYHLLRSVFYGVSAAKRDVANVVVNTTVENLGPIRSIIEQLSFLDQTPVKYITRDYEKNYVGFIKGLDNENPTIAVHDDIVVDEATIKALLNEYRRLGMSILTLSHVSTTEGRPISDHLKKMLKSHGENFDNLHHTALRVYDPEVKRLISCWSDLARVIKKDDFKEVDGDIVLALRGKISYVISDGIVNINTPEDYLRASKFLLGNCNYVCSTSMVDPRCQLESVSVENYCRIGEASLRNCIILPRVIIEDNATVDNAIICEDCYIAKDVKVIGTESCAAVVNNCTKIGV